MRMLIACPIVSRLSNAWRRFSSRSAWANATAAGVANAPQTSTDSSSKAFGCSEYRLRAPTVPRGVASWQVMRLHTPSRVACSANRGQRGSSHMRSEEHTSELQSHVNLVCRLLLEKKKIQK